MIGSPFELLGLDDQATLTQIKAAFRLKAAEPGVHPDFGGDTDTFMSLKNAYERALVIATNAPCSACEGKGSVGLGWSSFAKTLMRCSACGGSGKREH